LMDVNMPIMDGYEAALAITQESRYQKIPIIALTASQAKKDIDNALKVGMVEYLTKPIYMHQLYAVLLKYIEPKIQKRMPEVEDLILFSAKFNASIKKFYTLLQSKKTDDMEQLIIKMEKEANRVDIDMLNGMSQTMQKIFKTTHDALNNFLYEYEEASNTFLNAYDTLYLNQNVTPEEIQYAQQVLSFDEGVASFGGDKESYHKALSQFAQEYKNASLLIKQNIDHRDTLQNFASELTTKAQEIKAKIMVSLSQSLSDILTKEDEKLHKFIENYQHAFDTTSYN
ncbi:MAG: response regulator, partial [Campylobacterales bacterium]|nr:response regulator [Campylobacterales bacterium]